MNSSFLNVNAYEGDHQTFVMVSKRNYDFPMVFYQTGRVYTELAPTMADKTLEVRGLLLDDLAKARSLRGRREGCSRRPALRCGAAERAPENE